MLPPSEAPALPGFLEVIRQVSSQFESHQETGGGRIILSKNEFGGKNQILFIAITSTEEERSLICHKCCPVPSSSSVWGVMVRCSFAMGQPEWLRMIPIKYLVPAFKTLGLARKER